MQNVDELVSFDKSLVPNVIDITQIPEYDMEEYDLNDQKDFKKYIYAIEKSVRNSFEYRNVFIPFLRQYMGMDQCAFYKNINNIDTTSIRIEIHHSPFMLVDICRIIYNKRLFYEQALDIESVAEEVMSLHFSGMVGLVPLSETVHELVHNGHLFVPTSIVFGRYKDFIAIYNPWMQDYIENLNNIENYSRLYNKSLSDELLSRKYIHIDISGEYRIPKMEDIYQLAEKKIETVKYGSNYISVT